MTIPFYSYQMVKLFLELMESTIPYYSIPKYCNPVAPLISIKNINPFIAVIQQLIIPHLYILDNHIHEKPLCQGS